MAGGLRLNCVRTWTRSDGSLGNLLFAKGTWSWQEIKIFEAGECCKTMELGEKVLMPSGDGEGLIVRGESGEGGEADENRNGCPRASRLRRSFMFLIASGSHVPERVLWWCF